MLMAREPLTLPPMTLDHLTGKEGEPLTREEIELNKVLMGLGLDPIRNRPRPSCPWPRQNPERKDWLVLIVEPQQEVRTHVTLKSYQLRTYLPLVPFTTTRGVRRTKVTVYRPMMRGYLFVHEQAVEDLLLLNRPLPIHGFLKFDDRAARVADSDLRKVQNIEEELAKPKPIQSIWDVGEIVRIIEGPFTGFNATITDLANATRIRVDVPFMKRAVPMTVDADHLEKL